MKTAVKDLVQPGTDLGFGPEELLQVLDPFEIADDHAPGVAQDVRHHEDLRT